MWLWLTVSGLLVRPSDDTVKDDSLKAEVTADFEIDNAERDASTRQEEEEELRTAIREGEFSLDDTAGLDCIAQVDTMISWGHDEAPDEAQDAFIKATTEWIAMAKAVCPCP